jgi:hypothetical protein
MEDFVRAQKKFLDVVIADGAHARGAKAEVSTRKTELSKLAREAASSFIDAQKKLLDLAGQQVNVSLNTAGRAVEMMDTLRPRFLASLNGEGVKKFVDAEKAVFTSIMKPAETAKTTHKAVHTPKRPAPSRSRKAPATPAVA